MTDHELMALVMRVDPRAVRLPPGIKEIASEIAAAERESCAKLCDELQKNHDRYYRTVGHDGKPYDPEHCAVAIRARSNHA